MITRRKVNPYRVVGLEIIDRHPIELKPRAKLGSIRRRHKDLIAQPAAACPAVVPIFAHKTHRSSRTR